MKIYLYSLQGKAYKYLLIQEIMRLKNMLLRFMMSGWPFLEDEPMKSKSWNDESSKWWVYETKTDYISKVTWFLEDWVKQMKKDLSIK